MSVGSIESTGSKKSMRSLESTLIGSIESTRSIDSIGSTESLRLIESVGSIESIDIRVYRAKRVKMLAVMDF